MKNLFLLAAITIVVSSVSFGQSVPEMSTGKNATFTTTKLIKGWASHHFIGTNLFNRGIREERFAE